MVIATNNYRVRSVIWKTVLWVNRPLHVSQPGQLSLSSFQGQQMSSEL